MVVDGSGSVEVQHQRVRFAVLSEVPDSRDRLSEVGFFFLPPPFPQLEN